jgi:hypothetical protein
MNDPKTLERWRQLRDKWRRVSPGMSIADVEEITGFSFELDSENDAGRMVYSHHTSDHLPFYLVVDRALGTVIRKHDIRVLDEL